MTSAKLQSTNFKNLQRLSLAMFRVKGCTKIFLPSNPHVDIIRHKLIKNMLFCKLDDGTVLVDTGAKIQGINSRWAKVLFKRIDERWVFNVHHLFGSNEKDRAKSKLESDVIVRKRGNWLYLDDNDEAIRVTYEIHGESGGATIMTSKATHAKFAVLTDVQYAYMNGVDLKGKWKYVTP